MRRFHTYGTYTIGCAVAWAILWIIVGTQSNHTTKERVLCVFTGWLIGWTSATIARVVYPPPRSRRSS